MSCLSAGRTLIPLWENHSHILSKAADWARDKATFFEVLDIPFPTNHIKLGVVSNLCETHTGICGEDCHRIPFSLSSGKLAQAEKKGIQKRKKASRMR
jgi:hypothetical protein